MKSTIQLFATFLYILCAATSYAVVPSEFSYEDAKQQVSAACEWLAKGDFKKFVETLPKGRSEETDKETRVKIIDLLESKKASIHERYGASLNDVEFVREEASGAYWRKISFIQRFSKGACYWYFLLYRAGDEWCLSKLQFDPLEAGLRPDEKAILAMDSEPMQLANEVAAAFSRDEVLVAMETFRSKSELELKEADVKKIDLNMQLQSVNGDPTRNEFEIVQAETVGSCVVRYNYVLPRLKSGTQLQLTLYKGEKGWQFYAYHVSNEAPIVYTAVSTDAPNASLR